MRPVCFIPQSLILCFPLLCTSMCHRQCTQFQSIVLSGCHIATKSGTQQDASLTTSSSLDCVRSVSFRMSARSNGTMEDGFRLPILPSDGSLQSHLTALDLLTARLSTLTTRTRWPARIPLNSKASFSGCLIHTNDVKVNVGGDWWIEMTAEEAVEYVKRRKNGELV